MTGKTQRMSTRVDLRQAIEKEVLTYLTALQYDQNKEKLVQERNTTFTPLPKEKAPKADPAAKSHLGMIDYNEEDPMPQSGHYLISDSNNSKFRKFFRSHKSIFSFQNGTRRLMGSMIHRAC